MIQRVDWIGDLHWEFYVMGMHLLKLAKKLILASGLLLPAALIAAEAPAGTAPSPQESGVGRPKLVVGIVVDQMRWDYLYRFQDRYSEGGFRRLLREGFSCENTYINYVPSVTAIGHSSVYTGSVPAIHGITGNGMVLQSSGKGLYCTQDDSVKPVGISPEAQGMSPRNLKASTITDELRLATNFRSKVIGIALKDRGAILPAGHAANAAYWFDDATGRWCTSSYYMDALPDWVNTFNASGPAKEYLEQTWEPLHPLSTYVQSTPDRNPYERPIDNSGTEPKVENALPLSLPKLAAKLPSRFGALRVTPFGNTLTLDFARAAVQAESLGENSVPDFLAISLSSTDAAGHLFGTNSPKQEDVYLRLDRDLASFFDWLDQRFGRDNYLLFLTADHGAAHNAQFAKDHGLPAGVWNAKSYVRELNQQLAKKYGVEQLVRTIADYRACLNTTEIAAHALDESAIRADCVAYFKTCPGVAYAVDIDRVADAPIPASLREQIINGYDRERAGAVQIVLQPGWYAGAALGTTHGTPYPYDTHIPLVWMGWGVRHGAITRTTHITDIAATLAALLHIQKPNGCIGEAIPEVRRSPAL